MAPHIRLPWRRKDEPADKNRSSGRLSTLTPTEAEFFMNHGYVKLSDCFSRKQAADVCANVWRRLGMDPNDLSTWQTEWQVLPREREFEVRNFAPKAWGAICDLLGGEERIHWSDNWDDTLIVNLGKPEGAGKDYSPRDIHGWHVDGNNFVHFLDSPEQGLLVTPLWSDVPKSGGGTLICPDAIPIIARHLYDHPEGVTPQMMPRGRYSEAYEYFYNRVAKTLPDEAFVEMTGEVGDVYLLHPLMLHSVSNNSLRRPRIISNPRVQVKEPFKFHRPDPSNHSIVERTTMKALGMGPESLKLWRITAPRENIDI